jgi:hypothetical protein
LLKKYKAKYIDLATSDEELNGLPEKSISFYGRTLKLIETQKAIKFDNLFSKKVQPIGQHLINVLINIKFRVWLIRLNRMSPKPAGLMQIIIQELMYLKIPVRIALNSCMYKISLFHTATIKYTYIVYIMGLLFFLLFLLIADNYLINDLPGNEITWLNFAMCIMITISSLLFYPFGNFTRTKINGQDVIAYKYRFFFNNASNKIINKVLC